MKARLRRLLARRPAGTVLYTGLALLGAGCAWGTDSIWVLRGAVTAWSLSAATFYRLHKLEARKAAAARERARAVVLPPKSDAITTIKTWCN